MKTRAHNLWKFDCRAISIYEIWKSISYCLFLYSVYSGCSPQVNFCPCDPIIIKQCEQHSFRELSGPSLNHEHRASGERLQGRTSFQGCTVAVRLVVKKSRTFDIFAGSLLPVCIPTTILPFIHWFTFPWSEAFWVEIAYDMVGWEGKEGQGWVKRHGDFSSQGRFCVVNVPTGLSDIKNNKMTPYSSASY